MANENKKDFNSQLIKEGMPKVITLNDEQAKKWGGHTMVIAPPIEYNDLISKLPKGKLITTTEIRKMIAKKHNTDITCPLTCGIFINIVAWASYQRDNNKVDYYRVLKSQGELNSKYPGGVEEQTKNLENDGFEVLEKGSKNKRYYVKDYEKYLWSD